jgi:prolyl oligopeptidase
MSYLEKISSRARIKSRLTELWNFNKESAPFQKGNLFFCYKNNGLQNQSVLYVKKSVADPGEILLDPNALSQDGTISLSTLSISHDGKTLAFGTSKAGSDWVEIHFMDIVSKKTLPDVLKWVKFSGVSWHGNSVYYSRYDEPTGSELSQKNEFHKVFVHQLGNLQRSDRIVFEDKDHPDYNFGAYVTDDEKFLFISTSQSTSGEKLVVKDLTVAGSTFVTISDNFESDHGIVDNIGNTIYLLTNKDAPKFRLVSFTPQTADPKKWVTVIPETENLLEGVRLCNNKIIANYLQNVVSKL